MCMVVVLSRLGSFSQACRVLLGPSLEKYAFGPASLRNRVSVYFFGGLQGVITDDKKFVLYEHSTTLELAWPCIYLPKDRFPHLYLQRTKLQPFF